MNGGLPQHDRRSHDMRGAASPSHYLLLYDYVEDVLDRRRPYREAHLSRIVAEREAGRALMAGALGDPPRGAAIVFRGVEREFVEEFARGDPYVSAGLVPRWHVERWFLV